MNDNLYSAINTRVLIGRLQNSLQTAASGERPTNVSAEVIWTKHKSFQLHWNTKFCKLSSFFTNVHKIEDTNSAFNENDKIEMFLF